MEEAKTHTTSSVSLYNLKETEKPKGNSSMALQTILFQQDPSSISYESKDYYSSSSNNMSTWGGDYRHFNINNPESSLQNIIDDDRQLLLHNKASFWDDDGFFLKGEYNNPAPPVTPASATAAYRGKRPRAKIISKNKEAVENQRRAHITVERNRRKQMNHYLATLRSLMPPSYAHRGDQASIVGGAINFVKELENLVHFLEAKKQVMKKHHESDDGGYFCCPFHVLNNNVFSFPQYSTCPTRNHLKDSLFSSSINNNGIMAAEKQSAIADIQVSIAENHANIKVLSRKRPKQLFKVVTRFYSMSLTILHLNVTTLDDMVLYTFNVKVEDDCQLSTVHEIATAAHQVLGMIQEEAMSSMSI